MTTAWPEGRPLPRFALTLLISAGCGVLASLAGLPAGWLMGGALGVALAALLGVKAHVPRLARDGTFILLGMIMGTTVARESLGYLPQWPVTLLALAVEMVLVIAISAFVLQKAFGFDKGTAYLSSIPGHLSFVVGLAAAGVGNPRQIVVSQVIRLMMLTAAIPVATLFLPIAHPPPATEPPQLVSIETFVLVGMACLAAGLLFARLKVPAAYVLGSMFVAIALRLGGLFDGAMPDWLVNGCFIVIGGTIGQMFVGITLREFLSAGLGGLLATAMTTIIVTACAWMASLFVSFPFGQIWLALAPGGLETMGALSLAFGYDAAFIAAHHVVRLLYLTLILPPLAVFLRREGQK